MPRSGARQHALDLGARLLAGGFEVVVDEPERPLALVGEHLRERSRRRAGGARAPAEARPALRRTSQASRVLPTPSGPESRAAGVERSSASAADGSGRGQPARHAAEDVRIAPGRQAGRRRAEHHDRHHAAGRRLDAPRGGGGPPPLERVRGVGREMHRVGSDGAAAAPGSPRAGGRRAASGPPVRRRPPRARSGRAPCRGRPRPPERPATGPRARRRRRRRRAGRPRRRIAQRPLPASRTPGPPAARPSTRAASVLGPSIRTRSTATGSRISRSEPLAPTLKRRTP